MSHKLANGMHGRVMLYGMLHAAQLGVVCSWNRTAGIWWSSFPVVSAALELLQIKTFLGWRNMTQVSAATPRQRSLQTPMMEGLRMDLLQLDSSSSCSSATHSTLLLVHRAAVAIAAAVLLTGPDHAD